jgi:hypothetical protein
MVDGLASFTGPGSKPSRPCVQCIVSRSKRRRPCEGRRRTERGEEHAGRGAEYVPGQKPQVPAEAIEGVVKRIDLARPDFFGAAYS